jgi:hypothetical protein
VTYYVNSPLTYAWPVNEGITAASTGFIPPANGDNGSSDTTEPSDPDDKRAFPIIPVAIGAAALVAGGIAAAVILTKKKK